MPTINSMVNRLNNLSNIILADPIQDIHLMSAKEQQQNLTLHIFEILNKQSITKEVIREVLLGIKTYTGIEAVGIRLKDGDNYPYYETSGFSLNFVKSEMNLCAVDKNGDILRNSNNKPYLECLCRKVISGNINLELPCFTSYGSFWTNGTTELIKNNLLQIHLRNRFNKERYESVALIPIKTDNEIIGLLQLNDYKKNIFTNDYIQFFEKLSNSVGVAVTRMQTEEKLYKKEKKLIEAEKVAQIGYYDFDIITGTWTGSEELYTIFGINSSYPNDVPSWLKLVHPDHRDMISHYLLNDILRQNKKFDKEYKIIEFATGKEKWVHGLGELKFDENKNPVEMFGTIQDITQSKLSEKALQSSNTALKEILNRIEIEKKEQILSVQSHVNRTILPLVRKLKIGANDYQSGYISLIIDNLKTVASPFVGKLETLFVNLSPREIEICKMLKDGMTSKEIGEMLGTSAGTVFNQRKTIRKKLNIANDNINLVTFLKSI